MIGRSVLIISLLFMLLTIASPYHPSEMAASDSLSINIIDLGNDMPTYYAVDLPWFKQELPASCGAAALRTAFGQLGYRLIESEIRIAAKTTAGGTLIGDMVRAVHFSNASEEGISIRIDGYTGKPLGTDSYEVTHDGHTSGGRDKADYFLKKCLLEGKPVILLMSYWSRDSVGHYRVLRGYDDRDNSFIFTDSLYPNSVTGSHWIISSDSLYANYWAYSGFWVQIISPWSVSLIPIQSPSPNGEFQLDAIIDSAVSQDRRFAPWSLENVSISLVIPKGYSLVEGNQNALFDFNSSGKALISWKIGVPSTINGTDIIMVGVTGWLNGTGTHPWQVQPFDYCDRIYHETYLNLTDWSPPELLDFVVSADADGTVTVNASVIDNEAVRDVRLHWRMSATNWTVNNMQSIEDSIWQATDIIPTNPSGKEVLQFQIHADDYSGNSFSSHIYECDYTYTTEIPETEPATEPETLPAAPESPVSPTPPELIPVELAVIVVVGVFSIVAVVMVVKKRAFFYRDNPSSSESSPSWS